MNIDKNNIIHYLNPLPYFLLNYFGKNDRLKDQMRRNAPLYFTSSNNFYLILLAFSIIATILSWINSQNHSIINRILLALVAYILGILYVIFYLLNKTLDTFKPQNEINSDLDKYNFLIKHSKIKAPKIKRNLNNPNLPPNSYIGNS